MTHNNLECCLESDALYVEDVSAGLREGALSYRTNQDDSRHHVAVTEQFRNGDRVHACLDTVLVIILCDP